MSTFDSFIKQWSTTPASNGTGLNIVPYGWPENQAPSTVNDCARQGMADHRFQWEDAEWFCWGDTPSRASNTTFKIATDVTARYMVGRRLKMMDAGSTLYATIIASSYSAPDTTITTVNDSGNLSASLSAVALAIITPINTSIPGGKSQPKAVNGRLTLTTATPITTADVAGGTTLYFTPYLGNLIDIYNGTNWNRFAFSEVSIAVPATTDTLYDVFIYNNAGTLTLELTAWTNDTTRATALTTQDGVYVKTGATTRLYLGSVRTGSVNGQIPDTLLARYVWNYYNRVRRRMVATDTTNSWTYSSSTYRQANAATANKVSYVQGVSEDSIEAEVYGCCQGDHTSTAGQVGIGVDVTNANNSTLYQVAFTTVATIGTYLPSAKYTGFPGVGAHYLAWVEANQTNANTLTWYGDNGGMTQSGLTATIWG